MSDNGGATYLSTELALVVANSPCDDRPSGVPDHIIKRRLYNKERSRKLRESPAYRESERWYYIQKTYGLTKDQWLALLASQGNACACCGALDPGTKVGWHTDHDHVSQKVRGIVCHTCNVIIGFLKDSAEKALEKLGSISKYLEAHNG